VICHLVKANPDVAEDRNGSPRLECDFDIVIMTKGSSAMSSPEELTFVVGRVLRSVVAVLDVVRRIGPRPTSSREQRSTVPGR
jgi:hypothetical protein